MASLPSMKKTASCMCSSPCTDTRRCRWELVWATKLTGQHAEDWTDHGRLQFLFTLATQNGTTSNFAVEVLTFSSNAECLDGK